MRAHWHHLVNMIKLMHLLAHSSPQPKRQSNRFTHFCTAHGRKCLRYNGRPYPQEFYFPMGDLDPLSNTIPWAHESSEPKQDIDRFSHFCTDDCRVSLYFTMVCPFPPQNCRFPCGMWTWKMVPWAHLSPQPQRHLDRFSRICRAH